MGDEIAPGRHNKYLIRYYVEVCISIEERIEKIQLWKNTKLLLPGFSCHYHCYGIAAVAVAMALLPIALLPPPLLQCRFHQGANPEQREVIPTHPLFLCSVPNRNPPNQKQSP